MNMTIEDDEGHVIDLDNNGIFNEDRLGNHGHAANKYVQARKSEG